MIWLLGDNHAHFAHIVQALARTRYTPAAVIFLGDIEAQRPFEEEIAPIVAAGIGVFWIRGNHDTDTESNWRNLEGSMDRCIDGRVVEIDGLRVGGLGGVFRGEVWHPGVGTGAPCYASYEEYCRMCTDKRPVRLRKRQSAEASLRLVDLMPGEHRQEINEIRFGRELKHASSIFWNTYAGLWDQRADVLVTHEALDCHPHGFAAITELAQGMHVRASFHGHQHDNLDYGAWDARFGFRAFGVGFCGITALDPATMNVAVVQAGDFDEARRYRQLHPMEDK